MKIGIDCRLAGKQHAGIGRYIENLIVELPKLENEIDWVYFFSTPQQAQEILLDGQAQKTIDPRSSAPLQIGKVKIVYVPLRHYSVAEQVYLPEIFRREKLDLLHVPHFNIPVFYFGKLVITIHDLLWHEYRGAHVTTLSGWKYWLKYSVYRWTVTKAVWRAKKIFVPAETIRQTVEKYYPRVKNKIVVTKEGAEDVFKAVQLDSEILARSTQSASGNTMKKNENVKKELLYVGSLYPHKNIRLVIDALLQLPKYTLLIVGTRNVFQDEVRKYVEIKGLQNQVQFLGFLPDEGLLKLYKEVFALVQPSLSEGFGLTGVEAMTAQLPVLASDTPIFREIYQDAATFFDPRDVDAFVKAVRKLEKTNREEIVEKGLKVASQYSWEEMARRTLDVYKEVL